MIQETIMLDQKMINVLSQIKKVNNLSSNSEAINLVLNSYIKNSNELSIKNPMLIN